MGLYSFLFPKPNIVVLDIGARFMKAAQFTIIGKNTPVMTHFIMKSAAKGAIDKGDLLEGALIQDDLKHLIQKELKWTNMSKLMFSVGGKSVITKKIDIPDSESGIVRESIQYEASQYLPYSVEEANYDYTELPGAAEPGMKSYFFVATNKKHIADYNSCMNHIGLKVDSIDTSFFSLQRALTASSPKPPLSAQSLVLILDIGSQTTGFVVLKGGNVIFSRDLFTGTENYTHHVQSELGVSPDEAQNLVETACKGDSTAQEAIHSIRQYHSIFCREVGMGKEYFHNYFPDAVISRGYVTGGGSLLPGVKQEVEKALELKLAPLPVFRGIQTKGFSRAKLAQVQAFAGVCVGLVLRS